MTIHNGFMWICAVAQGRLSRRQGIGILVCSNKKKLCMTQVK